MVFTTLMILLVAVRDRRLINENSDRIIEREKGNYLFYLESDIIGSILIWEYIRYMKNDCVFLHQEKLYLNF